MAVSAIRIMCPNLRCRAVLAVPAEARGRMVRCRSCGTSIKVPAKQEIKAAVEPDPAAADPSTDA